MTILPPTPPPPPPLESQRGSLSTVIPSAKAKLLFPFGLITVCFSNLLKLNRLLVRFSVTKPYAEKTLILLMSTSVYVMFQVEGILVRSADELQALQDERKVCQSFFHIISIGKCSDDLISSDFGPIFFYRNCIHTRPH